MAMNIFRIAADLSHMTAKCILIFSIHRNRSAEGISLITQVLYLTVFLTRYTDIFHEYFAWNFFFKVFYILSSCYTIGIMRFAYPRTREREIAWKLGAVVFAGALILSPFTMMIFKSKVYWSFAEWLWVFSQILESVCVLPQLLLLRQTAVPTVITSLYIVFLGSYRGLYLVNWFVRELEGDQRKIISVIFGVIQTALYLDFAWVYWTRQRVKLRNGGIVDADDLRRGWLLRRIFGKHMDIEPDDVEGRPRGRASGRGGAFEGDEDDESTPALGHRGVPRSKWGVRGISISADDGVLEHDRDLGEEHGVLDVHDAPDAKMQDPDELAKALGEDEDDAPRHAGPSGIRSGDEWDD